MNIIGAHLLQPNTALSRIALVSMGALLVIVPFFYFAHLLKFGFKVLGISMAVSAFAYYYIVHPFPDLAHMFFLLTRDILTSTTNLFILVFLPLIAGMVLGSGRVPRRCFERYKPL